MYLTEKKQGKLFPFIATSLSLRLCLCLKAAQCCTMFSIGTTLHFTISYWSSIYSVIQTKDDGI